jgi:hypothetical protein
VPFGTQSTAHSEETGCSSGVRSVGSEVGRSVFVYVSMATVPCVSRCHDAEPKALGSG